MPNTLEIFLCSWTGSVAVEVVRILRYYESDSLDLPDRYGNASFWIARFVLTLIAGALAVFYEVERYMPAFHIGASAPVILEALSRGVAGSASKASAASVDERD